MKKLTLQVVPEPPTRSIAIVKPQSGYQGPFFIGRGKGEVDYVCGSCRQTIAKTVWCDSIRNIVVQCFHCQSYNEFPSAPESSFTKRISLTTGIFYFSNPVYVDFGKVVEGQVLPKHEMKAGDVDTLLRRKNEYVAITREDILEMTLPDASVGVSRPRLGFTRRKRRGIRPQERLRQMATLPEVSIFRRGIWRQLICPILI